MKRIFVTCLINVVLVLTLAAFFSTDGRGSVSDYLSYAGLLSILWAVLCILIGLIFLAFRQKRWGQGFLLTAGILLLLGFMECSFSTIIV